MPKGKSRSSRRQVVAELARVLNERAAKLQQEPVWEKEYDSLILGDGPKGTYSMDPEISQVNNNVLVIAGTGGGKTKSVVEANLLHAFHQSLTVLLTKRRLLDQYAPLLKSRGYDVKVLDLVHPERSDVGYDPCFILKARPTSSACPKRCLAIQAVLQPKTPIGTLLPPTCSQPSSGLHSCCTEIRPGWPMSSSASRKSITPLN